ncbi:MAG TPA: hypothetical protein VF988_00285 [Verrucomicrobiae bacterium]
MVAALGTPAWACDLCSIYSATEAQNGGKGIFAGVAEQFTEFGTLQMDGVRVPGNGEYIDSSVSQIYAGYNFNQHIGLQFNLPVIYRAYGDNFMRADESGIGDASLTANIRLYKKSTDNFTFTWTALGGIKFPTGDSSLLNASDGSLPSGIGGHDLALGSGSFDGLVGTGLSARWKRVFINGQMQYGIRTRGDFAHRYGNDWTWAAGVGTYLLLKDEYSLALQFTTSGESKGMDTFAGAPDPDSAETVIYAGPELALTWHDNLSIHGGVDVPLSRANSGEQLMPDYRVHAGINWRF